MDQIRTRDQRATRVLLQSARFNGSEDLLENRQAAIDWGFSGYDQGHIDEHFVPSAVGALEVGQWPVVGGNPIELNEARGKLPDDADLEFGISMEGPVGFHSFSRLGDGSFVATVSGTVNYAKKIAPPKYAGPSGQDMALDSKVG